MRTTVYPSIPDETSDPIPLTGKTNGSGLGIKKQFPRISEPK